MGPHARLLRLRLGLHALLQPQLVTCKPGPGKASTELVPDLAKATAKISDGRQDLRVQAARRHHLGGRQARHLQGHQVRHRAAVGAGRPLRRSRSTSRTCSTRTSKYKGPYKDKSKDKLGLKAIETPGRQDDRLQAAQAATVTSSRCSRMPSASPVRQDKDTSAKYGLKPFSTGPYKFESYKPNKKLTLVRNPEWKKSSDPIRKALPDKVTVTLMTNADEMDKRLINGDYDLDLNATGMEPGGSHHGPEGAQGQHRQPEHRLHPLRGLPADGQAVRQRPLPQGRRSTAPTTSRCRPPAAARWPAVTSPRTCCRRVVPGSDRSTTRTASPRTTASRRRQGQGRAEGVRQAERLQDHHRGPQQQAGRGRRRRGAAGVAEEGRHRGRGRPVRRRPDLRHHRLPEVVKKKNYGIIIMGWGPDFPTGQGFGMPLWRQQVHPAERQQQLRR